MVLFWRSTPWESVVSTPEAAQPISFLGRAISQVFLPKCLPQEWGDSYMDASLVATCVSSADWQSAQTEASMSPARGVAVCTGVGGACASHDPYGHVLRLAFNSVRQVRRIRPLAQWRSC